MGEKGTAGTNMCAHVKDPKPICRKRVGRTAGGMEYANTAHRKCLLGGVYMYVVFIACQVELS